MIFNSYNSTMSISQVGMANGSYLSTSDLSLLSWKTGSNNIWYGLSNSDVVELSIWDLNQTQLGWGIITGSEVNNTSSLIYLNYLNIPVSANSYQTTNKFRIYDNSKLLVNPSSDLTTIGYYETGSNYLVYNMVRNVVGSYNNQLVIKQISPSRTELKLSGQTSDLIQSIQKFGQFQVSINEVYQEYINKLSKFPAIQLFERLKSSYSNDINILESIPSLGSDSALIDFITNLYEDVYKYDKSKVTINQGIKTTFFNYLINNISSVSSFDQLDLIFFNIVISIVSDRCSSFNYNSTYASSQQFIIDLIYKYYYISISELIKTSYNNIYYSSLNNSLNFGNNTLIPILNQGLFYETDGSQSLIIKLKSPLSNIFSVLNTCWISNISFVPIILQTSINETSSPVLVTIGKPDFFAEDKTKVKPIENKKYSGNDFLIDATTQQNINLNKKINELNIDYSNFYNFVVYSSAEIRLKIFKNKAIQLNNIQNSIAELNLKNQNFILNNNTTYPYYTEELTTLTDSSTCIINSFDGYESYLYNSGNYAIQNGTFVYTDIVKQNDYLATQYDKTNNDSFVKNTPAYILHDSNNDDYIIFISMIGHFFDNIRLYISNIPSSKLGGDINLLTLDMLNTVLNELGWNVNDILTDTSIASYYLPSSSSLSSLSDQTKLIQSRVLENLPLIYKTKGTEASVNALLTCYGIPASLLNIREYGGYASTFSGSYTFTEQAYMYSWNQSYPNDMFSLNGIYNGTGNVNSFMYKLLFNNPEYYNTGDNNILFGTINSSGSGKYPTSSSLSGSGEWATGFIKTESSTGANIYFRVGYKGHEYFTLVSDEIPLFDGNVYSVLIRRNDIDSNFESTTNLDIVPRQYDLIVQRNDDGYTYVSSTSSYIAYNPSINTIFDGNVSTRIVIGGWFLPWNSEPLNGSFDKLEIFTNAISNDKFIDYANNINSYANDSGSNYTNLLFRMHVDYPFNVSQSIYWMNANNWYSNALTSSNAWVGAYTSSIYNSASCNYTPVPIYPYQFNAIEYENEVGLSNYGPNLFNNNKITKIDQELLCRLDNNSPSSFTTTPRFPSSNQLGIFVDPQDFKNKDIVRQLGTYDLMSSISDPSNRFESQYPELLTLQRSYIAGIQSKTQVTLFNELMTIYRLYFPPSVFESIKQLIPARTNTFEGILISPTIIERPKYQYQEIQSSLNTSESLQLLVDLSSSYCYVPAGNVTYGMAGLTPYDFEVELNADALTSTYVENNYISYSPDDIQLGLGILPNGKILNGYFPSASYYPLKQWTKYTIPYLGDIKENITSSSIYLSKYIKVSPSTYNKLVYTSSIVNSDPSYVTDKIFSGTSFIGWQHYQNTFKNFPNSIVNNVKLVPTIVPNVYNSSIQVDSQTYFEIVSGTPRNHKSHGQHIFSAYRSFNSVTNSTYTTSKLYSLVPPTVINTGCPVTVTNIWITGSVSSTTISGSSSFISASQIVTGSCNYNQFITESNANGYSSIFNRTGSFGITMSIFNLNSVFTGNITEEQVVYQLASQGYRPATLPELYSLKSIIGKGVVAAGTQLGFNPDGSTRGYPTSYGYSTIGLGTVIDPFPATLKFAAIKS